jgi:hypothetical protein
MVAARAIHDIVPEPESRRDEASALRPI